MESSDSLVDKLTESASWSSSGTFTLAFREALKKLKQFQLPRRSAWILKLVQSAVASQAPEITIEHKGAQTTVAFRPQNPAELQTLKLALVDPRPTTTRAVHHLRVAIWALSQGPVQSVECQVPGQSEVLVYQGNELLDRPAPDGYCLKLVVTWTHPEGLAATLAHQLRERASVCPIPLTLNGERLDGWVPPENGEAWLILAHSSESASLPLSARSLVAVGESRTHTPSGRFTLAAACLVSFSKAPALSGLCWVSDGIEVSQSPLEEFPAASIHCRVFVSSEGLQHDLSDFGLVQDEKFKERREITLSSLAEEIARWQPSIRVAPQQAQIERTKIRLFPHYLYWAIPWLAMMAFTHPGRFQKSAFEDAMIPIFLFSAMSLLLPLLVFFTKYCESQERSKIPHDLASRVAEFKQQWAKVN